jgi:hypothetical protein
MWLDIFIYSLVVQQFEIKYTATTMQAEVMQMLAVLCQDKKQ